MPCGYVGRAPKEEENIHNFLAWPSSSILIDWISRRGKYALTYSKICPTIVGFTLILDCILRSFEISNACDSLYVIISRDMILQADTYPPFGALK